MTDMFTGMPFYWQGGGGGGLGGLGGNAATGQPAMSSSQINASMGWNPYASFNPWANISGCPSMSLPLHWSADGCSKTVTDCTARQRQGCPPRVRSPRTGRPGRMRAGWP